MTAPPDFLAMTDPQLLRDCEVDTFRASGPGGQKRNKTSSAVRLRHRPTGLAVTATESRSQGENRARALRRLRERIALELRRPVELDEYRCPAAVAALVDRGRRPSRRHPDWLRGVQGLLDLFVAVDCSVRDTAARVGASTGALSRLLIGDDALRRTVNALRTERGLKPLR